MFILQVLSVSYRTAKYGALYSMTQICCERVILERFMPAFNIKLWSSLFLHVWDQSVNLQMIPLENRSHQLMNDYFIFQESSNTRIVFIWTSNYLLCRTYAEILYSPQVHLLMMQLVQQEWIYMCVASGHTQSRILSSMNERSCQQREA